MTIYENMAFGLKLRKNAQRRWTRRSRGDAGTKKNERQRKEIPLSFPAASSSVWPLHAHWCSGPPDLLLDEPFRHWTPRSTYQMREELKRIQREPD